jgi:hypothetical protein
MLFNDISTLVVKKSVEPETYLEVAKWYNNIKNRMKEYKKIKKDFMLISHKEILEKANWQSQCLFEVLIFLSFL